MKKLFLAVVIATLAANGAITQSRKSTDLLSYNLREGLLSYSECRNIMHIEHPGKLLADTDIGMLFDASDGDGMPYVAILNVYGVAVYSFAPTTYMMTSSRPLPHSFILGMLIYIFLDSECEWEAIDVGNGVQFASWYDNNVKDWEKYRVLMNLLLSY